MTTAYVDTFSGVSGDMLLGALVDAGLPLEELQGALDTLGVQGLRLISSAERRSSIGATRVMVNYPPQHEHRHLKHIVSLIESGSLPEDVKGRAVDVFLRLAEAEAEIHRIDPQRVHFHEVGAADAIADVVGTVFGFHHLGVDEVLVGPVNVGAGLVRCEHGLLPVPAPATLALLAGWVCHSAGPARELTTPTGAALVTTLGRQVESFPAMSVKRTGYGSGGADTPGWPNVLRVIIGESAVTGARGPRQDEAPKQQGISPDEPGHEHRHDHRHDHHAHQH
ncbi:MAG: nickel pincer cofactor biosynthesis protein LarC [Thermoleophilia bacterium]